MCRGWLAACPRRRCLLSALCAAVLTLVASVDGTGAGGQDSGELVALAGRDALIVDHTSRLILAVRVPMSLLDEGTTGAWYLPCVRAQLPQAIISALAADDEYRVPTGRKSAPLAAFNKNSCHPSSDKILNLRREPSKLSGGGHQFAAVAHKLFHAIPRGHRLPTIFDASVQRLRSIPEASFPLRGYPLMGPAGSGHGMEERSLPPPPPSQLATTHPIMTPGRRAQHGPAQRT